MKAVLTLIFCFVLYRSSAQDSLFNKVYMQDRPCMLFSGIISTDTGFYLLGLDCDKEQPFNYDRFLIAEMNDTGSFINYISLYDSVPKDYGEFWNCLIRTTDGGYAFTGFSLDSLPRVAFCRLDSLMGNIRVWEYQTPYSWAFQGRGLLQYDTGSFFIVGTRTDSSSFEPNVLLMKVDAMGNRLWEKYYGGFSTAEDAESIIKLKNGNLLIGSSTNDLAEYNEHSETWLLEVDTAGNIVKQWFDNCDSTYNAEGLKQTSDGGFIYGAQKKQVQGFWDVYFTATVVKLDSNFQRQWTYTYGDVSLYTGIYDIKELPDGNFIACGNRPDYDGDSDIVSGWIIKFSATGQVLWSNNYVGFKDTFTYNMLNAIIPLADGSFVACGQVNDSKRGVWGWLLRVDSNGNGVQNTLLSVNEPVMLNYRVTVSPNPFATDLAISIQQEGLKQVNFTIYNMLGQPVYTQQEINLSSNYTKMLDLSYLPNGVYFVKVQADGEQVVKEVVKE